MTEESMKLQIEQAAYGCISGTLEEWPALKEALSRYQIQLPPQTSAWALSQICRLLMIHVLSAKTAERKQMRLMFDLLSAPKRSPLDPAPAIG